MIPRLDTVSSSAMSGQRRYGREPSGQRTLERHEFWGLEEQSTRMDNAVA